MPARFSRRVALAAAASLAAGPALAQQSGAARPRYAAAARYSAERGGLSFLVMRHGVTLAEDYPNGGDPNTPLNLRSGTKSFAGVLAARLVRDRLLDLDEPAAFTLGEWGAEPRKNTVTVRQLLNLTSGVARGLVPGEAPSTADALAAPAQADPGALFHYDNAPFQVFVEIARRKLFTAGLEPDPALYLQARVLDPAGIAPLRWTWGQDGRPWLATGCFTTARVWARFGELVRRDGIWRARALVSRSALAQCFDGAPAAHLRYGLGWWLSQTGSGAAPGRLDEASDIWRALDLPADVAFAAGGGNQRLYVIPSRALVCVRQAPPIDRPPSGQPVWSDAAFLRLLLSEPA